ncbi:hypothetical protein ACLI10_17440, partial [Enterococcus faecalis]|uniref:hypothetical protein n=1 Tax=Enterococcus faecalis TaxID=1351 RepID=UPI003984857C
LDRHGRPDSVDALRTHDLLSYSLADSPGPVPDDDAGQPADPFDGPARVQAKNSVMVRDLVVAGVGMGGLPSFVAAPAIAA